jgi:hypothetical protein
MPNDRRPESLPKHDDFWRLVDNDATREFYNTTLIEMIRNSNPQSDTERIEMIAKLKLVVDLLDSPATVYQNIAIQTFVEQERKELESVL